VSGALQAALHAVTSTQQDHLTALRSESHRFNREYVEELQLQAERLANEPDDPTTTTTASPLPEATPSTAMTTPPASPLRHRALKAMFDASPTAKFTTV
jgi:hypothetical protein